MKTAGDRLLPTIVKHARHSGWNSTGHREGSRRLRWGLIGVGRAHPLTEKKHFSLEMGVFW